MDGGQCRRYLVCDMAALAHAADDHPTGDTGEDADSVGDGAVDAIDQRF